MKYPTILLIVTLAGVGIYYQQNSICWNPLTYDIGDFDVNFGITKDKFTSIIKEAETVWERDIGQDLFNYQPGTKFKVSLIFDERQELTIEGNQSKEEIEESRISYEAILSQYKLSEAVYRSDFRQYEFNLNIFQQQLDTYNNKVAELNNKGGATPKEYQGLEKDRKFMEDLKTRLDRDRATLNSAAARLNYLGDQVNELAQKLNIEVDVHNQVFGEAREFDQGEYINGKINIYQFDAISDLRLVIAHELGHALGLDHVENPKSIMYYLMEKQNLNNIALTQEDKKAFRQRCEFHVPKLRELFN